ncbi:DNA polymerase-3 subunit gamma/tau [Aequitasia blattaphilus]|uniref:DNA-directed DNA polymerase n=1 Tax=Aequitasia blattaphilus TaxID=2949332 RepID=A0ABT1EDN0_9FIRM|nr:DNA polymerase III subunit gamma/tau [Aequitasia blattaphilus]MCP1102577.1 DNA polymerase III subunit gamma/tau [Aequitasia blattaphilus]MCR8615217.1 DNA polymerase III subunit gamma/tau [Aequitasia blattaphilus]
MSYTALYRKFRPETFEDVKGQDAIVKTLKNQIQGNRIGHAYLFCGTRGTGKTSVAKIMAKAVNCENPQEGSPCGVCETCKSIAAGTSMNVIEIDAASNNGVDNIREIREEVSYRPTEGRYKVYIIDEVHMLSIGAFNALLKTLEEPPEYVIFILATTEVHKIPITILSRCQRYDFKRISIDTISERLHELVGMEGIDVEDKAIRYIARVADGAMRDALSLLDQCVAFHFHERLTYDHVLEIVGTVDTSTFGKLFTSLVSFDVAAVLNCVEELVMEGKELFQLSTDFIWYLRNLLLAKNSDNLDEVLDVSSESLLHMKEETLLASSETLIYYIRRLSEMANQMRYSSQKRVLFEVTLIKLCKPQMEEGQESLLERIRALEEKADKVPETQVIEKRIYGGTEEKTVKPPVLAKALPEDVREVAENFRGITMELDGLVKGYLKNARISVGDRDELLIVMPDEIGADVLRQESHINEIKRAIEEKTNRAMEVSIRYMEEGRNFEDQYVDIEKLINMEIEIEEES